MYVSVHVCVHLQRPLHLNPSTFPDNIWSKNIINSQPSGSTLALYTIARWTKLFSSEETLCRCVEAVMDRFFYPCFFCFPFHPSLLPFPSFFLSLWPRLFKWACPILRKYLKESSFEHLVLMENVWPSRAILSTALWTFN